MSKKVSRPLQQPTKNVGTLYKCGVPKTIFLRAGKFNVFDISHLSNNIASSCTMPYNIFRGRLVGVPAFQNDFYSRPPKKSWLFKSVNRLSCERSGRAGLPQKLSQRPENANNQFLDTHQADILQQKQFLLVQLGVMRKLACYWLTDPNANGIVKKY